VSKRHQNSRRKSYGRRQHELHERRDRRRAPEPGIELDEFGPVGMPDRLSFLDPRTPRLRFALD